MIHSSPFTQTGNDLRELDSRKADKHELYTAAALRVVNEMRDTGVIGRYAIGGAVAATFYIEPTSTFDIDIFISFGGDSENPIAASIEAMGRIYKFLRDNNYKEENGYALIAGWGVQFLPAEDNLLKEALEHSVETEIGGVKTWIMSAEHLMAIALRTNRPKDLIRLEQFVRYNKFSESKLNDILGRAGLVEKWNRFNEKYIEVAA